MSAAVAGHNLDATKPTSILGLLIYSEYVRVVDGKAVPR